MSDQQLQQERTIPETLADERLDVALAKLFPEYSRSTLQTWLKEGAILVNGKLWKAKDKVRGGELISLGVTLQDQTFLKPEAIELDIVFEDADVLVINKPSNFVVHPGAGNAEHTLLNALLYHDKSLTQLPRAGIIHRLDKDTTGLMVVAKSLPAHTSLTQQLQQRTVHREYEAIVAGEMISGTRIDLPISRDARHRTKMGIAPKNLGKEAITHVRILERYPHFTRLRVNLETGRTHQIRVHLSHVGYPIVGDSVYGPGLHLPPRATPELIEALRGFKRQALHARALSFIHPTSQTLVKFKAKPPEDFRALVQILRNQVIASKAIEWEDEDDDWEEWEED